MEELRTSKFRPLAETQENKQHREEKNSLVFNLRLALFLNKISFLLIIMQDVLVGGKICSNYQLIRLKSYFP